jgi:hypothetical protein
MPSPAFLKKLRRSGDVNFWFSLMTSSPGDGRGAWSLFSSLLFSRPLALSLSRGRFRFRILFSRPLSLSLLCRHLKCLGFDPHEHPADSADRLVEIRTLDGFQILEQMIRPWRQMFVKKRALAGQAGGRAERPGYQAAHDFAQGSDMIFGLGGVVGNLNAQFRHGIAQIGERFFIQKTRQIIGRIGLQLGRPDTDKQIVKFFTDGPGIRRRRRRAKRPDGAAKVGVVRFEPGEVLKSFRRRGGPQQRCQQRIGIRAQGFF